MTIKVDQGPHRAISTAYAGPTDHRGSRVIAKLVGSGKRFTFTWQSELGPLENHDRAAVEVCKRMNWDGTLYGASVNGGGYIYVLK